MKIQKLNKQQVRELLNTNSNPYNDAINKLSKAEGVVVNKREFMRANRISNTSQIGGHIRMIERKLKCKLAFKQIKYSLLITKK